MAFSSLEFLYGFLPVVLVAFAILRGAARNILILCASLAFYAWTEGAYATVLLVYIFGNWALGLAIERAAPQTPARIHLTTMAVIANLAGLVIFKYAGFLTQGVGQAFAALGLRPPADPGIHLPIGISFFAFQGISYVVDVSRAQVRAASNLVTFGAYKAFFPQVIAGPIVRYRDVAADFASHRSPTGDEIAAGIRRFAVGLAKKVLIANSLAVPADAIFGAPAGSLSAAMVWYGAGCYALQLYFDFSGYSDMAIGLGRLFGIHIRENFQYPYTATTVRDFWRRWHISLSGWFRDYVYVPLGGSRGGPLRTTFNLWIVFLLCGLWHGAQWTFVAWGAWHGVFLVFEHVSRKRHALPSAWHILGHTYTMLVVLIGWVIFRSESTAQALDLLSVMFGAHGSASVGPLWLDLANGQTVAALAAALVGCTDLGNRIAQRLSIGIRNILTMVDLAACTIVLASAAFNPFIYFRF